MADSCAQYVSTDDLKAAKESILHIEHVATSKDANGNPALVVTDPIRGVGYTNTTLDGLFSDIGFKPVNGSFEDGGTLVNRWDVLLYETNGSSYQWAGTLPHTVPAGSSPFDSGNNLLTGWIDRTDLTLRSNLASSSTELGDSLMTVVQPGANRKSITQHEFNSRFIHVDDSIGTYGDGVTPDTAGFLNAITDAKASGANTTIILTPGKTYYLPFGIDIDGVGIVISGYGASIKYGPTNFTYEHCLRVVNTGRVRIEGVRIFCDAALTRDQTGFAILIANSTQVVIDDIELENIASAGVWATQSSYFYIANVHNNNNKADGIHVSNGCHDFMIGTSSGNGCHDDTFAVVSDTPGTTIPYNGTLFNIKATNSIGGHGLVLIGCANINVVGLTALNCAAAGFGSYFWNGADHASDDSWVRNCNISNLLIESCGSAPVNPANATGMLIGALKNCTVDGGRVSGAPGSVALGVPANCIQVSNAVNTKLRNVELHNSNAYGLMCLDSLMSSAAAITDFVMDGLGFTDIVSDVVHLMPAGTLGSISWLNSTLVNAPYDTSAGRAGIIGKTGSSKLTIAGNKNTFNRMPFTYDAATCQNVETYSNVPHVSSAWTCTINGVGGTPAATALNPRFYREGDFCIFDVEINVSAGSGNALEITLPFNLPSVYAVVGSGWERNTNGKMVQMHGNGTDLNKARITNADNSSLFGGSTGVFIYVLQGRYTIA